MGICDIFRRKGADLENQGDDFVEGDFIAPAKQCDTPERVCEDATDDQAQ